MGNKQSKYLHFINENMFSIEMIEDNSNTIPFIDRMFIHPSNDGIEFYHENNHITSINWIKIIKWSYLGNLFKIIFNISNKSYYLCFLCIKPKELSSKMNLIATKLNDESVPN